VIGDSAVADSHGINRLELDGLTGRSDTEKVAKVRAVVDLEGSDNVGVDSLPMDFGSKVGKGVAESLVEDANAGFVGCGTGLGSVIDEVVGEQLVEQGEIALALDLFGVAADHRLEGFTVAGG